MKLFEYLYYCLYRMFALIKRVGEKDENLASFFYSVLLSTNVMTLSLPLKFIIPKGFFTPYPYNILIKIILGSVFVLLYFTCKSYFLEKDNHVRIILNYKIKFVDKNRQMALVGILYSFFTFVAFLVLALWLSRM